jgi:3-phosphoshikimate 1-carboxyvinyltransferase
MLIAEPPGRALGGSLRPAGDKSISHRALIFAGLAAGESRIDGLLVSADTSATRAAMEQLGAVIRDEGDTLVVQGTGERGLQAPTHELDMGNSGTAMRLLAGVLAGQGFRSVLTGDESLSGRPMGRIIRPLQSMGARISAAAGDTAPLHIDGHAGLQGVAYASPVASAQIKSCLLLAGLYAKGVTSVTEPHLSRDHTERMLPLFGVSCVDASVTGGSRLHAADVVVPADPSSAAFLTVAALLVPGSEILLQNIGLNPTRVAFYDVLCEMGAELVFENQRNLGSEPVADLRVCHSGRLRGVDVSGASIPAMIDEVPALLALAACADGVTRVRDAAELRVKESDRLAVMGQGLRQLGIEVTDYPDGIDITGGQPQSGSVDAHGDHRCAMSFAALGQVVEGGVHITGAELIGTSYPGFHADMGRLGASLSGR